MTEKSRVPWLSIIVAGLIAFVVSLLAVAIIVGGYAFTLAMRAQGPPDQNMIASFANRVIPFVAPLLLSLLVIFAGRIATRRASAPQLWYGLLVGIVAVLPTLVFTRSLDLREVCALLLPPASGLLGAYWGLRAHRSRVFSQ